MNAKTVIIFVILLVLIGAGGFYLGQTYKLVPNTPVSTPTPLAKPDPALQDTPTQAVAVTVAPVDSTRLVSDVRAGLVAEHGQDAASLTITVKMISGVYAEGAASEQGGGGMWFAVYTNGEWKLVWDGNGSVLCSDLTPYPDFPKTMISMCWDDKAGQNVTR